MDFTPSDTRQMLADSLTRYLADQYPVEHRNAVAYDAPFHDASKWQELVELGVLHALVPEEAGGFGGAGFDITTVFQALGTALCPEPVLPALMAARLLAAAGQDVTALMEGSATYAPAWAEVDAPYQLQDIAMEARVAGDGCLLSGRKALVYGGQIATHFLVAARLNGLLALFDVKAQDADVQGYGLIDGGGAAELLLDQTPATLLLADAEGAWEQALNAGALALCAEAVGAMQVAYDTTLDYLKQRKQFGVPIGKFQVLQHRTVDLLMEIEQARSITIKAAAELDGPQGGRYVSMAKHLIGRAARQVAEEAIQMHGGIAMTWEYPLSHYAKRLTMLDAQMGDTDEHLSRVAATLIQ
ncbi:MAG: acyl-CoA dehydrogenase [Pseudomonadota bacterium]|nr:acyl-CoA dehydrogenase [Pseudomonadota bacterium]MEC8291890.1 acyl-CoA dehydrogenase [Pseudomonadota bacterium]